MASSGIVVKSEVFQFDESALALDPICTAELDEPINELASDRSIVIVTHNAQGERVNRNTRHSCISVK